MGDDLSTIQVNTNDVIKIDVVKIDDSKDSILNQRPTYPIVINYSP